MSRVPPSWRTSLATTSMPTPRPARRLTSEPANPVELDRLIAVAASKDAAPEIAIRVNPKIGAGGHAKITTGGATAGPAV